MENLRVAIRQCPSIVRLDRRPRTTGNWIKTVPVNGKGVGATTLFMRVLFTPCVALTAKLGHEGGIVQ